jgi:hypothetical protein
MICDLGRQRSLHVLLLPRRRGDPVPNRVRTDLSQEVRRPSNTAPLAVLYFWLGAIRFAVVKSLLQPLCPLC